MTIQEERPAQAGDRPRVFDRILLKLSGEALMGEKEFGLDLHRIEEIAREIV